ncbi:hypothetical protein TorRG33x02_357990, partial [Trema orientale]
ALKCLRHARFVQSQQRLHVRRDGHTMGEDGQDHMFDVESIVVVEVLSQKFMLFLLVKLELDDVLASDDSVGDEFSALKT